MATSKFKRSDLIGLLVLLAVVVLGVAVLFPAFTATQGPHPRMNPNANLRSIVQTMAVYAMDHKGRYPGIEDDSSPAKPVEQRFQMLVEQDYFEGAILLTPKDLDKKQEWISRKKSGPMTTDHYSYAMLQVPTQGGRRAEWNEDRFNARAALLSDRNTGTKADPDSVWDKWTGPDTWIGGVAFSDGHVSTFKQPVLETRYGETTHKKDHLFRSNSNDDALMVYSGN